MNSRSYYTSQGERLVAVFLEPLPSSLLNDHKDDLVRAAQRSWETHAGKNSRLLLVTWDLRSEAHKILAAHKNKNAPEERMGLLGEKLGLTPVGKREQMVTEMRDHKAL